MSEFVEIYWRSSSSTSLSSLSLSSSSSNPSTFEFVIIYKCRRYDQVPSLELEALEADEIYSRLRPDADEFAVFEQLPRSI